MFDAQDVKLGRRMAESLHVRELPPTAPSHCPIPLLHTQPHLPPLLLHQLAAGYPCHTCAQMLQDNNRTPIVFFHELGGQAGVLLLKLHQWWRAIVSILSRVRQKVAKHICRKIGGAWTARISAVRLRWCMDWSSISHRHSKQCDERVDHSVVRSDPPDICNTSCQSPEQRAGHL